MVVLLDFKTSKSGAFYPEMGYQLSAYSACHNRLHPKQKVKAGIVICLDKESGSPHEYILRHPELTAGWKVFILVRKLYDALGLKPARYYGDESRPSVTTCLGILDKPALVQWAANSVHDYWMEHLGELRNPATSDLRITMITKNSKTAHHRVSDRAKGIGVQVHEAIETFLAGADPYKVIEGNVQAQTAFSAYLQWHEKVNLRPIALETQLIWEPNRECPGWGGTADCVADVTL